jgi:hypothetical protein
MKLALAICVGAAFAAEAVGQTPSAPPDMTGWNRVGELRDGQRIIVSVGSGFPIHCVFRGITDHSVFCDTGNLLLGFYKREIARDEVTWLRTDNYPRDRGIVMGVLGTAGVVFGAASAPSSETAALKVDSALLFGLVGTGVGYVAAIPIAFFLPGKTIYALPKPPSAKHLRWPERKRSAKQTELAQAQ